MPKHNKHFYRRVMPSGTCLLCDYTAGSKRGLILHMKYSHLKENKIFENEEPIVKCAICKKENCKMH